MTETSTVETIPGYLAGTWSLDQAHTDISFTIRHMMVSKVRGHFTEFEGTLTTGTSPLESSVTVTIDLASINTNNERRDGHIRTADFFDVEHHPKMTYVSTGVHQDGDEYVLEGDLTLRGVTKSVPLHFTPNGFFADPQMGTRAGFSARGTLNRHDFGVSWNNPVAEGTGMVLGDEVELLIEVEAKLDS